MNPLWCSDSPHVFIKEQILLCQMLSYNHLLLYKVRGQWLDVSVSDWDPCLFFAWKVLLQGLHLLLCVNAFQNTQWKLSGHGQNQRAAWVLHGPRCEDVLWHFSFYLFIFDVTLMFFYEITYTGNLIWNKWNSGILHNSKQSAPLRFCFKSFHTCHWRELISWPTSRLDSGKYCRWSLRS